MERRERKKEGGERQSIDGNQVSAQRENQGEKWMDHMFGDDRIEAIDEQWEAMSVMAIRSL